MMALALEKTMGDKEITVVDDFEAGIPEVGKSTLFYVVKFLHDFLEIPVNELINEIDFAWKTSVYFADWCGREFHSPLGKSIPSAIQQGQANLDQNASVREVFEELYYRHEINEFSTLYTEIAERPGLTPMIIDENDVFSAKRGLVGSAYHFNSADFNDFLRNVCRRRGIRLENDRIHSVKTNDSLVKAVRGQSGAYPADLYVDATGFQRVLMNEIGNKIVPFDLPVDSAVVTTTDIKLSEIQSATVVTSGQAGWFWQIDTTTVRDIGYVYSSDHLKVDQAIEELTERRDEDLDPSNVRHYTFNSGVLETPWLNNCVAIGNALGFVEPLQSTALSTTALLAERLSRLLKVFGGINHSGLRELINTTTLSTWEEVYDFVSLYYKYSSGSTPFWKEARSVNPGTIDQASDYRRFGFAGLGERATLRRTGTDLNGYPLYHLILRNLGIRSTFYEQLNLEPPEKVRRAVQNHVEYIDETAKQFLTYDEYYQSFH